MDAAAWDERYREAELLWSGTPNTFVARELADLPPGRALDLASGEGRNAIWLAERGWDVEAVDFSSVALDRAARWAVNVGVTLRLTRADVTDPPMLEPADLVLLSYLQLPRTQAAWVHAFAASLVRPGGTLLLVAHARRNLTEGTGGPQDPDLLLDADEVQADLEETGLAILKAEEGLRTVTTDEGDEHAIDLIVRARRPAD